MKHLDFTNDGSDIVHICTVVREGEWAVFKCPYCPDYVRKINLITGDMKNHAPFNYIRHQGNFVSLAQGAAEQSSLN